MDPEYEEEEPYIEDEFRVSVICCEEQWLIACADAPQVGKFVWAKIVGLPWWPGKVTVHPFVKSLPGLLRDSHISDRTAIISHWACTLRWYCHK